MRRLVVAFGLLVGCASSEPGAVTDVTVVAPAESSEGRGESSSGAPRRAAGGGSSLPPETPPAPSADEVARARQRFAEGVEAFQSGDYASAEEAFTAAYAITPKWQVLYNLGQVQLVMGKTAEACATFEKYWVTMTPPNPSKRAGLPIAKCPNLASLP